MGMHHDHTMQGGSGGGLQQFGSRLGFGPGGQYLQPGAIDRRHEAMWENTRQYGKQVVKWQNGEQPESSGDHSEAALPGQGQVARHALRVSKSAERAVKQGHPWVFASSITFKHPERLVQA